jgi:hypothetical protein
MNTNSIIKNGAEECYSHTYGNIPGSNGEIATQDAEIKDNPIVHEAKIITPQPYGVFALCKIMEHFQIN